MIITLKGADFSKKKIGTLTTWSIFTNLGTGASYNGVLSVNRNSEEPYEGIVTLVDGYEIGAAGVSVTMGGEILTEGIVIDGNTITITIEKITGPVYITVPTVNINTGEEDDGSNSESGDSGNGDSGSGETNLTSQFTWTPGTNIANGGVTQTSDTNWLYSNAVDVSAYSKIRFAHIQTSNANTTLGYTFFDSSMNAVGYATNGGTSYTPVDRTVDVPSNAKYFRCMWINTTSSNYDASIHDISKFYCYGIT